PPRKAPLSVPLSPHCSTGTSNNAPTPTKPWNCWNANVKPHAAKQPPSPRHPRGHRRRRELPATPRKPPPWGIPPAVFHPPPVARTPPSGRPFRYRPAPTPHTRPPAPPRPPPPAGHPPPAPARRPLPARPRRTASPRPLRAAGLRGHRPVHTHRLPHRRARAGHRVHQHHPPAVGPPPGEPHTPRPTHPTLHPPPQ